MKKKLIIGIAILVIGVVLAIVGVLITKPNSEVELKPNEQSSEKENKNEYQDKEIIIFDYTKEETSQDIKTSFTVYNNSSDVIENSALFLEFYEDNKKVYTAEFAIDSLKAGEELTFKDESIVFLYDKVTSTKFKFLDSEPPVTSKKDYLKEYKTLDANKTGVIEEETETPDE